MKEKLLLIVLIMGTICTGGNAQTKNNPRNSTQTKVTSNNSGGALPKIVTRNTIFAKDGFGYCSVCKEGKWGAEDLNGNIVIPCEFDTLMYESFWEIADLISGCCFMVKKNDAYALYSREGKCIIPLSRKYKSISSLYSNIPEIGTIYSCFCENDRTEVYCNFEGKEVCKWDNDTYYANPKYMKGVFYFNIFTKKDDPALWGVADGEGKIYIEPKYKFIGLEDDKYFLTYVNDEKKLLGSLRDIKTTNNPFIGNKFDFPKIDYNKIRKIRKQTDISNRIYYIIDENNKSGIINDKGNWIIPLGNSNSQFEKLGDIYIKYLNNGFYSIVSIDGTEVIPSNRGYTNISNYNNSNKTFTFIMKGYSGICNIQGKEISKTKLALTADEIKNYGGYASISDMSNGNTKFWKVSKDGRYGLTNADGKEIVPTEMEALESAGSGYLRYKLNGFWGLMNYQGKVLIDTDRGYTFIGDYKTFNKRFAYTMNGYKGECDATGRQISKIKIEETKQSSSVSSSSGSVSSSSFTSSSSNSSSRSNNSGNNTTTVVVEHHRDPIPVQEWQECTVCWGSGTCPDCSGHGNKYIGNNLRSCWRCGGRGKCSSCSGQGGRYITVYR